MQRAAVHTLPEPPVVPPAAVRVDALNAGLTHHGAWDVLDAAFGAIPDLALVSSFGAESVVLLHLASMVNRDVPVLFVDTAMLFAQTLDYQRHVAARLRLRNVRIIRAAGARAADPDGTLNKTDPDACCTLRKTQPLQSALAGHGGWITGRKQYQSRGRRQLAFFELDDAATAGPARIKVNPLARWSRRDVIDYMTENNLPRHPLVAAGYPSIGCAPCTSPVAPGEDPRAGRWRGTDKDECGIHFADGKLIRTGA